MTNDPDVATISCRLMTTKLEESLSNLNEELAPTFDIETRISGKDQGRINAVQIASESLGVVLHGPAAEYTMGRMYYCSPCKNGSSAWGLGLEKFHMHPALQMTIHES